MGETQKLFSVIVKAHSHMEVLDAVDLLGVVVGVGHSVQAHPTHRAPEAGRVVRATERFQNLVRGMGYGVWGVIERRTVQIGESL